MIARRKVLDGDSHDAVEMVVDVADAGREFVPKHLLFAGWRTWRCGLGEAHRKEQGTAEHWLQGKGLLTAGIVAGGQLGRTSAVSGRRNAFLETARAS